MGYLFFQSSLNCNRFFRSLYVPPYRYSTATQRIAQGMVPMRQPMTLPIMPSSDSLVIENTHDAAQKKTTNTLAVTSNLVIRSLMTRPNSLFSGVAKIRNQTNPLARANNPISRYFIFPRCQTLSVVVHALVRLIVSLQYSRRAFLGNGRSPIHSQRVDGFHHRQPVCLPHRAFRP